MTAARAGRILDPMETVGCACGYRATGENAPALRSLIRVHVRTAHPEMDVTEDHIRDWVALGVAAQPWTPREVMPGEPTEDGNDR